MVVLVAVVADPVAVEVGLADRGGCTSAPTAVDAGGGPGDAGVNELDGPAAFWGAASRRKRGNGDHAMDEWPDSVGKIRRTEGSSCRARLPAAAAAQQWLSSGSRWRWLLCRWWGRRRWTGLGAWERGRGAAEGIGRLDRD